MSDAAPSATRFQEPERAEPALAERTALATVGLVLSAVAVALAGLTLPQREAGAIPPFARRYRVACQTCHVIIPKLNTFGEAFRLNGYRIPEEDDLYIRDEPLELGAEPWRDLFPDAIWPSDIPGMPPIGMRVVNDVQSTWRDDGIDATTSRWSFEFPAFVELLAGGRMGDSVGFFSELGWTQGAGTSVGQATMIFNPSKNVGIRVGLLNPQFLLGHSGTSRVGRSQPLWGTSRLSDWAIAGRRPSGNRFRLLDSQAGVEVSGIVQRRLHLSAGLVNGNGASRLDQNTHKDVYTKAKLKLFGRDFYGSTLATTSAQVGAPVSGGWVDNSLLLEGFAYWGVWTDDAVDDRFNYLGLSARALWNDLDLAVGLVHGDHDNPWFLPQPTGTTGTTYFAKAEYMFYPWLMGRLVYASLEWDAPFDAGVGHGLAGSLDQTRLLVGPVLALRANIRIAAEAQIYTRHVAAEANGLARPHNFWIRLDYAF